MRRLGFVLMAVMLLLLGGTAYAKELVLGSSGEEVLLVQQRLIELGYMNGEADGQYGNQTSNAIILFQRANGLVETGTVNTKTYKKLFSDDVIVDEVVAAQQRLIKLGFLDGNADGVWGNQSMNALKLFQTTNSLPETGELDAETKSMLFSDSARRNKLLDAQNQLIRLDYLKGTPTSQMDEETSEAIRLYQRLHDLPISGELTEETLEYLNASDIPHSTLQSGSKGEQVTALQQRLILLGFLDSEADGIYGKQTVAAVNSFQKHLIAQGEDISATGKATPITQEFIFSECYSSYIEDVHSGDESSEVLRIETRLVTLGYMDAQADMIYDDYAAQSMQAFCEANGVPMTVSVNQAQIDHLFSEKAIQATEYVAHDISMGDSGQAVRQVEEALRRYGMMTAEADGEYDQSMRTALENFYSYLGSMRSEYAELFSDPEYLGVYAQEILSMSDLHFYTEDVQPDATEEATLRVQRRLATLYYLPAYGVDGQCANMTQKAISSFQEENGLDVTGIADQETQRLLFSDEALGNWTDYLLEVRINEQRVYVYQLNESNEYVEIDRFICSTGLGNSTPRGTFLNTGPMNWWHYFEKFDCWAQCSFQIDGDILFHSVLYSEKDTDTLRESSVHALGSKASHGCVRLSVADAKWIFQNCEKGTIVIVR